MRVLRSSESQKGKKDKQRLWLKRPMTQRLIFHGKNSEESLVILEGRAPAQATGDGTRLVRVRQSTITTEGKGSMYFTLLNCSVQGSTHHVQLVLEPPGSVR